MAPPTGLSIGRDSRNPTWRVGKKIGEGVCGTVHELKSTDSNEKWAIKMAPLPGTAKGAKKKTLERNANLLNMEKLMYTAQLNSLRGTMIPQIPSSKGPPDSGDIDGFRYLVMEHMEAPLWDVVPALLKNAKQGGKIPFGAVACRMLDCIEAIHGHHLLFVDVKPENFMLSRVGKTVASQIRMIDLGLLQDMRRVGGMRPNESGKDMVGTPLYASLNVHEGHTIGPRDDLEAVGYVIGELILVLQAAVQGKTRKDDESLLPWSNGTSDEHIHQLKQQELTSTRSSFFSGMSVGGNDSVERIMREYFSTVQSLRYKSKPDYDALRDLLSGLDLVLPAKKKKGRAASKTTPAKGRAKTAAPPPIETTRSTGRTTRSGAAAKRPSPRDDDDAPAKFRRVIDVDDSDESGEDYVTCPDGAMDWEAVQDENEEPSGPMLGAKLIFTEGPHKGKSFSLLKGRIETIVLGGRPSAADGSIFRLDDRTVDASHARLVLKATKRLQSIDVFDMKSESGTYVNRNRVARGKDCKAFNSDIIQIGDSKIKVYVVNKKGEPKRTAVAARASVGSPLDEDVVMQEASNSAPSGPRIQLLFVEGPLKNQSIVFQKGELEVLTLGSNPTAKKGETYAIRGQSIDANHARLELSVTRKIPKVVVYDLMSKEGTFVKNERIAKGKDCAAFRNDRIRIGDNVMILKSA